MAREGPTASPTTLNSRVTKASRLPLISRVLSWMVHFYTFLGIPINFYCLFVVLLERDPTRFIFLNWLAIFVDATDGTLARMVDVKKHAPSFDGSQLDNITDFLTFSVLPALAIPSFNLVPDYHPFFLPFVVLLASAYQFCQVTAKTSESFVGFPSYWNIVFLYMYVLQPSQTVIVAVYLSLSILSFIPLHFVYPSKTRLLRPVTLGLGVLWSIALCLPVLIPDWPPALLAVQLSLLYPVYYTLLSLYLHIQSGGTY